MGWTAPHPRRRPNPAEIEEGRRKIEELDRQIANAAEQIEEIDQLKCALQQERRNCQSFIAPFQRMPTEILCEIARHAVYELTPPMLLNQICSAMRDAVNGFKAFWKHINISRELYAIEYTPGIKCKNRQWLQVLLQRASPSSLFIRIAPSALFAEMLEPLIPFSSYIDTIEMDDSDRFKSIPIIQLSAMNFSRLQSFSYTSRNPVPTTLVNILDVVNRFCHNKITLKLHLTPVAFYPALAHSIVEKVSKLILNYDRSYEPRDTFKLGTMPYFRSLETYKVPCLFMASILSSLTHLDLEAGLDWERIDIEDIPYGIQSLRLARYEIYQRHENSMSVYRFPDLKHINFILTENNVIGGCILAPQLEWLEVKHSPWPARRVFSSDWGRHFVNGALFGSYSLSRLHLDAFNITGSCIQNMRSLSTCRHLHLEHCVVSDDFVMGLSSSPGSPDALFPILEKIYAYYTTRDESGNSLDGLLNKCAANRPSLKMNGWWQ